MENSLKSEFISLYNEKITRPGAKELLSYLEGTDFFTAPASTRYHLARSGGLVEHSINVFKRLSALCANEAQASGGKFTATEESAAVCGLLHDVCKANFYTVEMRNKKNAAGAWEQVPYYSINDTLPYGHGEKSVYIISAYMKLSREEAMAIRWHMGAWNEGESNNASNAFGKYPLALLCHIADMEATFIDESTSAAGE